MADVDLLAAVGLERGEARIELARSVEAQAREWLAELRAPLDDVERPALVAKRDQFRDIVNTRLGTGADACAKVPELIGRLGELEADQQVTVLRDQLATILMAEGETVRACAATLEVCLRIDEILAEKS